MTWLQIGLAELALMPAVAGLDDVCGLGGWVAGMRTCCLLPNLPAFDGRPASAAQWHDQSALTCQRIGRMRPSVAARWMLELLQDPPEWADGLEAKQPARAGVLLARMVGHEQGRGSKLAAIAEMARPGSG